MREVEIGALPLRRFAEVLPSERVLALEAAADAARRLLAGRIVWNVNSTAHGGGVAEILQTLLAYGRGAGVDTRWAVLAGDGSFFATTKRLHHLLHGAPGDGAALTEADHAHYERVLANNLDGWVDRVSPGDVVLLHDPQTAGMVEALRGRGARVVWRCHIGTDRTNAHTDRGWSFLRPYVEGADAWVFSRAAYVPPWLPAERVHVIAPSLDPFSAKNAPITPGDARAALDLAGIVADGASEGLGYTRRDGTRGAVRPHSDLLLDEHGPLPSDASVVLQVSRWDRLKDMAGVLTGFAGTIDLFPDDAHLLLVGPDTAGVSDDPEGAEVLAECRELRAALPRAARDRVHLCCLPMDDVDENAHLVNALQRHADLVVQKSLVEGFGLTVTEPMWKGRAVLASAVGGIVDQIEDDVSGVLLEDPTDVDRFGVLAAGLLADDGRRDRLGAGAHARVLDRFLGDRHLIDYGELFASLLARTG
ncbi:glycosyltransferase [Nocardioides sp. GY 10113]|uniref:glycosyltransferase n=1 Tax=Nocardioides sp. GY 10113 TaxID=2569761 RepID=UPI0010A78D7B|nr:glycosyltransferase [Nocardioides sp. GY 10113]TIC87594.1 glycosyltransferase [Nocardioides sp. GY 10113]